MARRPDGAVIPPDGALSVLTGNPGQDPHPKEGMATESSAALGTGTTEQPAYLAQLPGFPKGCRTSRS